MRRLETLIVATMCALGAHTAFAVGTPAGTSISNQAQVRYSVAGTPANAVSNPATFSVAEVLDVNVTLQSPDVNVVAGELLRVLRFQVTNTGNGPEALRLALDNLIAGDDFDPLAAADAIFFDSDASGTLTPADVLYLPGSNDPVLDPDASVAMLLVNGIPLGPGDGAIGRSRLIANCTTGTGVPGTGFPGQGVGGTEAVVGANGATANATGQYVVGDVVVSLVKSVAVSNPAGGSTPTSGAALLYQIQATVTGTGTARSFEIGDLIPADTNYVAGSLRLNGSALTDAADADAGEFQAAVPRVRVLLGDLSQASGPQTVSFNVTIR
jgi:uncharacterized repeat protein (TIGR01451 family)